MSEDRPVRRVGVNLLWLVPGVVGGSEEYTTRLLRGLAGSPPPDLHLTLFALAPFADAHPDLVAAYPTVSSRIDGHRKPERGQRPEKMAFAPAGGAGGLPFHMRSRQTALPPCTASKSESTITC